jgi:hypothetical protein
VPGASIIAARARSGAAAARSGAEREAAVRRVWEGTGLANVSPLSPKRVRTRPGRRDWVKAAGMAATWHSRSWCPFARNDELPRHTFLPPPPLEPSSAPCNHYNGLHSRYRRRTLPGAPRRRGDGPARARDGLPAARLRRRPGPRPRALHRGALVHAASSGCAPLKVAGAQPPVYLRGFSRCAAGAAARPRAPRSHAPPRPRRPRRPSTSSPAFARATDPYIPRAARSTS